MPQEKLPLEIICQELKDSGRKVKIRTVGIVLGTIPGERETREISERQGWLPWGYKTLASESTFDPMRVAYDHNDVQLSAAVQLATQRISGFTTVRYEDLHGSNI